MYCTRNVSDSVVWVGASDRRLALFENLFPIPRGVSYNSYLILDEKNRPAGHNGCFRHQTVSGKCQPQLKRQTVRLSDHQPYGPDHCANIAELLLRYPHLTLVATPKPSPLSASSTTST